MYSIRRDSTRLFYKRRPFSYRLLLISVLLAVIGAVLVVYVTQFDTLRAETLKAFGVAAPPTPYAGEFAQRAAEKFVQGDLEGARADYAHAVKQQPNNISYLYEYGMVLIELDRAPEASVLGDRAVQVAPSDVRSYALKAMSIMWNDPNNAVTTAIQGRNLDPNFSNIYTALSIAYYNLGRYDLSLENGQLAIEKDPMNPLAYRAYFWTLVIRGQYELAIEQLEKAIEINPNLTAPYFQLAFEYRSSRINNPAAALVIYEGLLQRDDLSRDDRAKANLRLCELLANIPNAKFDEAEPYCQEAINIKPEYGEAYKELGRMRYNRRNYEGAIEAFETCVALGATNIECWALRGLAHYWMGQCDSAWSVLNEAAGRARAQGEGTGTIDNIDIGIGNVIANCPAYNSFPTPTVIPPTPIPPTPIGGL